MEVSWSVPHVSQGRGPEETDGGMAINQLVLGGGPRANNGAANGGGGCLILLKSVYLNHANITSVVSEICWPPLNSETVKAYGYLVGIFLRIFLEISMENGTSWIERWIFLRVSGISLRVSWISFFSQLPPFSMDIPTDLPETERQKTPGSLYHLYSIKANRFFELRRQKNKHMNHVVAHRSDLLLLNMVQGARSFLSFCFW